MFKLQPLTNHLNISPMASNDFSSIPVLDYSLLSSTDTRNKFIEQLRHALINVGFLYLSNHSVSNDLTSSLIEFIPKLFALPQEEKEKIRMANSEHFLGYSKLGAELTKGAVDYREQFDFATRHTSRWKPGDPDYYRLWGTSQVGECIYPMTSQTISILVSSDFTLSGRTRISFRDSAKLSKRISSKFKS